MMKPGRPKSFPTMKMPNPPVGRGARAGFAKLAEFAHHAPTEEKVIPRMSRPGKAHGPHN